VVLDWVVVYSSRLPEGEGRQEEVSEMTPGENSAEGTPPKTPGAKTPLA
jgi:hypothetical protein